MPFLVSMSAQSEASPVRICLLALPETTPSSIYGLHEIFTSVGVAWQAMTGETAPARRLEPCIAAKERSTFASPVGPPIAPQASLEDAGQPDVIIVTDLVLAADYSPERHWTDEAAWVRAKFEMGAIVCSICTGSVFLAETGLLDGVEATTHWGATRIFAQHYPKVRLRSERIICPAGPEHRLVTGGGAGAWSELALYLIARFCGQAEAVRIAKVFVLGDKSDGQLPFAAMGRVPSHEDSLMARCQEWLADHYVDAYPVGRMTTLSGLPQRTFKRRFRAATGYAPIDYVQALRVEEAKQMLEMTSEPTDVIAAAVGYSDPTFFRRLFKRMTGVTPAPYRQRYQLIGRAEL